MDAPAIPAPITMKSNINYKPSSRFVEFRLRSPGIGAQIARPAWVRPGMGAERPELPIICTSLYAQGILSTSRDIFS
jgi:hypothetical protein